MMTDPLIALTMGDPCGIGPEIIAKLFRPGSGCSMNGLMVVGDVDVMRRALSWTGGPLPVAEIDEPADLVTVPAGCLPVLHPSGLPADLV